MPHYYFDHNATAPVAPEVLCILADTLAGIHGNASSIHYFGQAAKQRLELARRQVARLIDCEPAEIVFTSGGTESDNLAILGTTSHGEHVIATAVEHPAVLGPAGMRESTTLPVDSEGRIDPADVCRAIRPETRLITVMHANNETGVMQPIREIASIARDAGILFHCDAVQTVGRVPLSVRELHVDMLSMSGHKFGAPKGIGALFVRKGVKLQAQMHGGHHEKDRRAGTENVPGAAAMGMAAQLGSSWEGVETLRDRLELAILRAVPGTAINGGAAARVPNTSSIRFDGISGEALVIALDLRGYAVSSGSACSSGAVEPSHVLLAMGQSKEDARSGVRFSLGPVNTGEQVDGLIAAVVESVAHLRRISPISIPAREPAHAR